MMQNALHRPSSELALLLACDLAEEEDLRARAGALPAGFDWQRFGRLAFAHDMAGLVGARLVPLCAGRMPGALADELTGLRRAELAMSLTQIELTARLSAALEAAGVPTIVLKGTALGHLLYAPCPEWRTSLDIDLLVAPDQIEQAQAVLLREGLVRGETAPASARRGRAVQMLLQNASDFIVPDTGQLVELHHRICRNPGWIALPFSALMQNTAVLETAYGPIRTLTGPVLVSHLCWHALSHFGYRLKWFCDAARTLRHFGAADCSTFAGVPGRSAHQLTLVDAVLSALGAGGRPSAAPRWARRAGTILAALEDPQDIPVRRSLALLADELRYRRLLMQLSPGAQSKAFEAFDLLTDPRDAQLLGLGPGFAPVYAVVGPLLALLRMIRRQDEAG